MKVSDLQFGELLRGLLGFSSVHKDHSHGEPRFCVTEFATRSDKK